jgi:cellulose synthase/poly-beta-1,6-N-acetylglucosamine synthase-like glycosyltransferase
MFWTSYDLVLSIAAVFFKSSKRVPTESTREFQIVIPAYKEGEVLITTVQKALKVDYPKELFKVTVLAQELDDTILKTLRLMPVDLVETGGFGSKLNALKNWMKGLDFTENQFIFVLDADNLIEPNALQIADANLSHYDVIQLERIKTPPQSPLGILDRWNTSVGLALSNDSRMVLGLNTFLLGS